MGINAQMLLEVDSVPLDDLLKELRATNSTLCRGLGDEPGRCLQCGACTPTVGPEPQGTVASNGCEPREISSVGDLWAGHMRDGFGELTSRRGLVPKKC